jgi:hypothetical protein
MAEIEARAALLFLASPLRNPADVIQYYNMKTMSFRVTDDEARLIRSLAKREKLTLSDYLRRRATSAPAIKPAGVRRTRCKHTGATIFAASPELPPLSTESVREMLADFP